MTRDDFINYCQSDNDFNITITNIPNNPVMENVVIKYEDYDSVTYPINITNYGKAKELCEQVKQDLIREYNKSKTKLGSLLFYEFE